MDSRSITTATISATGFADQHLMYKVELYKTAKNGSLQPVTAPVFVGDNIVSISLFHALLQAKNAFWVFIVRSTACLFSSAVKLTWATLGRMFPRTLGPGCFF